MSVGVYLWQWVKAACTRAWIIADSMAGLVALLGAVWITSHPTWGAAVGNLAWQLPLGLLVILLFIQFVRVPYHLHVEAQERIKKAETHISELIEEKRNILTPKLEMLFNEHDPLYLRFESGGGAAKKSHGST
jgi:hypothetical protein